MFKVEGVMRWGGKFAGAKKKRGECLTGQDTLKRIHPGGDAKLCKVWVTNKDAKLFLLWVKDKNGESEIRTQSAWL